MLYYSIPAQKSTEKLSSFGKNSALPPYCLRFTMAEDTEKKGAITWTKSAKPLKG
jgi:hypothetical protein